MGLPVEAADVLFEALSPTDFGGSQPVVSRGYERGRTRARGMEGEGSWEGVGRCGKAKRDGAKCLDRKASPQTHPEGLLFESGCYPHLTSKL